MSAPCTCGHASHEHSSGRNLTNPFGCDRCPCEGYREDPSFVEFVERTRFVHVTNPSPEHWELLELASRRLRERIERELFRAINPA